MGREERREAKFWEARASLLLWPIEGGTVQNLRGFLADKLEMDQDFLDDMGEVRMKKQQLTKKQRTAGVRDEYCVTFESKQVRDTIKAKAANLSEFRDSAGMRLQVPDHLQKDFKLLMGLSYDLKQIHKELKRNIKFDEDELNLFMDVQIRKDGQWKRIRPSQAKEAAARRQTNDRGDAQDFQADEIRELLQEKERT